MRRLRKIVGSGGAREQMSFSRSEEHMPMNVESPRSHLHYPNQEAARFKQRKPLALLPLVAVIFYDVSGGPFGVEVSRWLKIYQFCSENQKVRPEELMSNFEYGFLVQDAVQYGSPLVAVLGFLILPLAWSVPEALVTAGK